MNNKIKMFPTRLGLGVLLGVVVAAISAEAAPRPSGAYAWLRRFFIKAGEAAADQAARQAITAGAPHEEYELTSGVEVYWDILYGRFRGDTQTRYTYRSMWLDPVTRNQSFETFTNAVLAHRYPFYYQLHNRSFQCRSTGDPENGYDYRILAGTRFLMMDRVVKAMPGHEVLFHPVRNQFGMKTLAPNCDASYPATAVVQNGTATLPRGGDFRMSPWLDNADIEYFLAWYDSAQ